MKYTINLTDPAGKVVASAKAKMINNTNVEEIVFPEYTTTDCWVTHASLVDKHGNEFSMPLDNPLRIFSGDQTTITFRKGSIRPK